MAIFTTLPELFSGPTLSVADPIPVAWAAEGVYVDLLALAPVGGALRLCEPGGTAVGFVLLFDALFEDRLETAHRLYRLLTQGRKWGSTITAYRRARLKLALRALDASLDGAEYRTIAEALFSGRVLTGAAFREDSLRAQAIRLVRYGTHLMRGGYLDLLRPERRQPRRRR